MIRTDWLFEPADALLSEAMSQFDRLGDGIRSIGIDEKLAICSDGMACGNDSLRIALWFGADLHLHHGESVLSPSAKLFCQLSIRITREAAAAINRDGRSHLPQQAYE